MNITFCNVIQHALVVIQFFSEVACKKQVNPYIVTLNCQNKIAKQFHFEFDEMIRIMKENITPQINKQIKLLTKQPDHNYANYFKYDIEFTAQYAISRIERAHETINYDKFFKQIDDCKICDQQNQTSRNCLQDENFKKNFVNSSMRMFDEYPLDIGRKKMNKINEFRIKNDLSILIESYTKILTMFNETQYIEHEMQNMIKDQINDCCSKVKINKIDL